MDLNELLVFAKVVQAGSFTAAARGLRMPKSTVSRKVSELEERVGAQLLQRTTRKLRLTDVGQAYYEHCARIVAEAEAAELAVTRMQAAPHGLLRVTAPLTFSLSGRSSRSSCSATPRCSWRWCARTARWTWWRRASTWPCARESCRLVPHRPPAREHRARRRGGPELPPGARGPQGAPRTWRSTTASSSARPAGDAWTLHAGQQSVEVAVHARLAVNEPDMLRAVALAGAGVALLPTSSAPRTRHRTPAAHPARTGARPETPRARRLPEQPAPLAQGDGLRGLPARALASPLP